MNSKNLIGSRVALVVSDPWEFGTECGTGPFWGDIKDKDIGKVLILLTKTISYGGNNYSVCICTPRHQGKDINDILNGEKIAANMMLISEKVASFSDVNRQSQYKTQAIIGTIEQT
jgi:hypothetical protein